MTKPPFAHCDEVIAQHLGILGKTGAGKTNTGKVIVEHVVASQPDAAVCIFDPVKSDWMGLTLSRDGERKGLDFPILGGPYGHVPLHADAGDAIGAVVASGALRRSVIDMKHFGPGGHNKFFIDFAERLFRDKRRESGVLYLVIDEAHIFCPKERTGASGENMAIYHMKRLASASRSIGVRLIVLTQRTQELHNAVLGSCDSLIVHRITLPADREPVVKWVKGNAEKDVAAQVIDSMSTLPLGDAWLVSGEVGCHRVKIPLCATYDNTATPTGKAKHERRPPAVDASALAAIVGKAVEEAKANDPKLLNAEIAKLKAELAKKAPAAATPAKPVICSDCPQLRAQLAAISKELVNLSTYRATIGGAWGQLSKSQELIENIVRSNPHAQRGELPGAGQRAEARGAARPAASEATPRPSRQSGREGSAQPAGDWKGPQRELLDAFAWFKAIGIDTPTKEQLAFKCGWRSTSGHIKNILGSLRSADAVKGFSLAIAWPAPDIGTLEDYHAQIRSTLDGPGVQLFDHLLKSHPDESSRDEACADLGWSSGSGHIKNVVGKLRSFGVVEPRGWKLTPMVFPEGLA